MLPGCDDEPAICCDHDDSFHAVTSRVLNVAVLAIIDCIGPEDCKQFAAYVPHHEPVGGGDYIAAWLADVTPTFTPPQGQKLGFVTKMRLNVGVALSQTGYPGPEVSGGEIKAIPSADEYNHVAPYDYGLAEKVYRRILMAAVAGDIQGCGFGTITRLYPESPAAEATRVSARWRFNVALDVNFAIKQTP